MNRIWMCSGAAIALALTACSGVATTRQGPAVATAAPQAETRRLLPLEGVQNARDIGGYRTADGRTVKWGLLFRTGELSHLTQADIAYLKARGVRSIHDLRTVDERRAQPTAWTGVGAPPVTAFDYNFDTSGFAALFEGGIPSAEKAREVFAASYPEILRTQQPQHRALFTDILKGEGAVLYHCTAGKDRTGIATALILSALGVPRDTIIADYELSNRYYRGHVSAAGAEAAPQMAAFMRLPKEVTDVFMGVDARYLQAIFTTIDRDYGSVEAYLDRELGVGKDDVERLRAMYLR